MQIKMVEDELTRANIPYDAACSPVCLPVRLSRTLLTPSSLIAPVRADRSSQSFSQEEHSAFPSGRVWHVLKREEESTEGRRR